MTDKLQWEIYVPIFKNRYILRGLGIAIGIPFGILIAVILLVSEGNVFDSDTKYALLLIGALLLLTFIFIMIVYGGRYAPGFIVDSKGITNYTQAKQRKKNRIINSLLITLGLFSGNMTAAGAGMLANSRQVLSLKWKHIRKVKYDPQRKVILLRGGLTEKMAVFCTPENYTYVEAIIRSKVTHNTSKNRPMP